LRFSSSLASTNATVASSSAFRMPRGAAMRCTKRSTRLMFGAPAITDARPDDRAKDGAASNFLRIAGVAQTVRMHS